MSHIVRIDSRDTHGWQVRISTDQPKVYRSKFFSDSKYGCDKNRARVVATTYLLDHIPANEPEERPPFYKGEALSRNNTSGTRGVYRSHEWSRGKIKYQRYYWAASYTIDRWGKTGVRRYKPFHIDKHGEREAKAKAIAFREAWEEAATEGVEAVRTFFLSWCMKASNDLRS